MNRPDILAIQGEGEIDMDFLDKHLVPDWRQSWRWASLQGAATRSTIAVLGVLQASPDLLLQLIPFLPSGTVRVALVALVILVVFVWPVVERLWNQGEDNDATE